MGDRSYVVVSTGYSSDESEVEENAKLRHHSYQLQHDHRHDDESMGFSDDNNGDRIIHRQQNRLLQKKSRKFEGEFLEGMSSSSVSLPPPLPFPTSLPGTSAASGTPLALVSAADQIRSRSPSISSTDSLEISLPSTFLESFSHPLQHPPLAHHPELRQSPRYLEETHYQMQQQQQQQAQVPSSSSRQPSPPPPQKPQPHQHQLDQRFQPQQQHSSPSPFKVSPALSPIKSSPWLAPSISSFESINAYPQRLNVADNWTDSDSGLDDGGYAEAFNYPNLNIKERQKFLNEVKPFGFRLWRLPLTKDAPNELTEFGHGSDVCRPPLPLRKYASWQTEVGQVVYLMVFGWWLALVHLLAALILYLCLCGPRYATLCLNLASYLVWPFGKHIEVVDTLSSSISMVPRAEYDLTPISSRRGSDSPIPASPGNLVGRTAFSVVLFFILIPAYLVAFLMGWALLALIPVSKVMGLLAWHLYKAPHKVTVCDSAFPIKGQVIVCLQRVANWRYLRCQFFGVPLLILDLCPLLLLSLLDLYLLPHINPELALGPLSSVILALIATIPLICLSKMAFSSLVFQCSLVAGCLLNTVLGSAPELILIFFLLRGSLPTLAIKVVAALLTTTWMVLPGTAMVVFGWQKRKARTSSRSSCNATTPLTLLAGSLFLLLIPSCVLHLTKLMCDCEEDTACALCLSEQEGLFQNKIRPFLFFLCGSLVLAHLLGLVHSLKTTLGISFEANFHKVVQSDDPIQPQPPNSAESPQWSKIRALCIFLVTLAAFSLVSFKMVSLLPLVVEKTGLSEAFVGHLVSLFLASSELYNIMFAASKGDLLHCREAISQYTSQILLLLIPLATMLSGILVNFVPTLSAFYPLFSVWALSTLVASFVLFSLSRQDVKGTYFLGFLLLLSWLGVWISHWMAPAALTSIWWEANN